MDNFVDERDFQLLQEDKHTFLVLRRIIEGCCQFLQSDHNKMIICYSCNPYPIWIWTSKDISNDDMERIYKLLLQQSFLDGKHSFNVKYELADFLINRAKQDNITLRLKKNMFAYECVNPIEPSVIADGKLHSCSTEEGKKNYTQQDYEDFCFLMESFHRELQIDLKSHEEFVKDAENCLKTTNVFLWKNCKDENVACCRVIPTENMASVSLVFTHPDFRRKHYAENMVYQVTQIVKEKGFVPTLYTDADYAASNACYEKIGYVLRGKLCTIY